MLIICRIIERNLVELVALHRIERESGPSKPWARFADDSDAMLASSIKLLSMIRRDIEKEKIPLF